MSDERSSRPKHGTVPGFGPPAQALPPLAVQPISIEPSEGEDVTLAESAPAPELVAGAVHMVVEPTPHPEAAPARAGRAPAGHAPAAEAAHLEGDGRRRGKGPPAVDIDLVYERRSAPLPDQPWIFLEVWTRNTIYQLDSSLLCMDVIDQGTRKPIQDHPLRGARLVGGQSRDGEAMELSHPFPRPGSEAVFEQTAGRHVRFSQTSSVTRVVMRLRVLTVEPEQLLPTWEDVSGRWDVQALGAQRKK
jgi:hypothetical protein